MLTSQDFRSIQERAIKEAEDPDKNQEGTALRLIAQLAGILADQEEVREKRRRHDGHSFR